ncbi:MAG: phosphatidylinositol mannoside acyltransferase [Actinomycetota bacterium]
MTRLPADGERETLRERLDAFLYLELAKLLLLIPERALVGVAGFGGNIVWALSPKTRHTVGRNLARVTGESGRALSRRTRAAFRSYTQYWVEFFRLGRLSKEDLDRRLTIEGLDLLDSARAGGKGVILLGAHLGNWDIGGAWLGAHGYQVIAVAEQLRPERVFRYFAEVRQGYGIEIIGMRKGMHITPLLCEAIERGRTVGLLCDRDLKRRGDPVTFFGAPTTLPTGAVRLAAETGAAVLVADAYQVPGGWRAVIEGPLDMSRGVQAVAEALEGLIRRAPEQWHLFQPLWPEDRSARGKHSP